MRPALGVTTRAVAPAPAVAGARRGMTLIETLIAVVILSTALVALGNFMGSFSHVTKTTALQQRALDLATDRIDSVKRMATYAEIDSMAATENITADSAIYKRQTIVLHVGGGPTDTLDYKTITVSVTMPGVATPLRKTTIIADF